MRVAWLMQNRSALAWLMQNRSALTGLPLCLGAKFVCMAVQVFLSQSVDTLAHRSCAMCCATNHVFLELSLLAVRQIMVAGWIACPSMELGLYEGFMRSNLGAGLHMSDFSYQWLSCQSPNVGPT